MITLKQMIDILCQSLSVVEVFRLHDHDVRLETGIRIIIGAILQIRHPSRRRDREDRSVCRGHRQHKTAPAPGFLPQESHPSGSPEHPRDQIPAGKGVGADHTEQALILQHILLIKHAVQIDIGAVCSG